MMNNLKMFLGLLALTLMGINASLAGDDMDYSSNDEAWEDEAWERFEGDEEGFGHERAETYSARDGEVDIRVSQEELALAINQRPWALLDDSSTVILSAAANSFRDNVDYLARNLAHLIDSVSAKYRWNGELSMTEGEFNGMMSSSRAFRSNFLELSLDLFRSHAAGYVNAKDYHLNSVVHWFLETGNADCIEELIHLSHQVGFNIEKQIKSSLKGIAYHASMTGWDDGTIIRTLHVIQCLVERNIFSVEKVQQWFSLEIGFPHPRPDQVLQVLIEGIFEINSDDETDLDPLSWTLSFAQASEGVVSINKEALLKKVVLSIMREVGACSHRVRLSDSNNVQRLIQVIDILVTGFGADAYMEDTDGLSAWKIAEDISEENPHRGDILDALADSSTK